MGMPDELPSLDGIGLTHAVHTYTAMGLESYVLQKQEILRKAGYGSSGQTLRVKPRIPDGWQGSTTELLVDFGLGLVPHLVIEGGDIVDHRFGIPAVLPSSLPTGELHITDRAPAGHGSIHLQLPHSQHQLRLSAKVYLPHGISVRDNELKVRYSFPFFDLAFGVTGPTQLQFQLHLPSNHTSVRS